MAALAFFAVVFLAGAFLAVVFFAVAFFAVAFLAVVFFAVVFLAVAFFAVAFLAVVFLAVAFLAVVFLAGAFFAIDFLAVVFLAVVFFAVAFFAADFLAAGAAFFAAGLMGGYLPFALLAEGWSLAASATIVVAEAGARATMAGAACARCGATTDFGCRSSSRLPAASSTIPNAMSHDAADAMTARDEAGSFVTAPRCGLRRTLIEVVIMGKLGKLLAMKEVFTAVVKHFAAFERL